MRKPLKYLIYPADAIEEIDINLSLYFQITSFIDKHNMPWSVLLVVYFPTNLFETIYSTCLSIIFFKTACAAAGVDTEQSKYPNKYKIIRPYTGGYSLVLKHLSLIFCHNFLNRFYYPN